MHGVYGQSLRRGVRRIWTLSEEEDVLELQASAGMYTRLDGAYSQIPVGNYKIGLIAQERHPYLTNDIPGDPRIHDKEWAKREGMVAFAGYPLVVEDRLVGVMAMFALKPLRKDTLESLASVADAIAQGIRRKRIGQALRESEQRFRRSFDDAAVGMALVAPDGRFLRVNRSLCEILGYPERDLLGKTFQDITHPEDLDADLDQVRRMLVGEMRAYQMEKRYFHKEGHVVWALLSVSLVHDEEDEPLYFVSQIQDITERKVLEERLEHRAYHDTLTDLPNRPLLVNRLAHALERTQRRWDRQAVVLFMDLDGFKVVNDSLGHDAGDHLLVLIAERLRRCLRPEDTLARFGGDEFVVILEDVEDPSEAVRVAERITNELKKPFMMDGRSLFASFSIGIAQGNARTKSPLDLLRDADTAMYRAKSEHADYRVFDPAMYERAMKRLELENDLRRGVENREVVVHYQPIVDLETGETWGMEALLRWEHPEQGLLEASEFMAVFEESGLAVPTEKGCSKRLAGRRCAGKGSAPLHRRWWSA